MVSEKDSCSGETTGLKGTPYPDTVASFCKLLYLFNSANNQRQWIIFSSVAMPLYFRKLNHGEGSFLSSNSLFKNFFATIKKHSLSSSINLVLSMHGPLMMVLGQWTVAYSCLCKQYRADLNTLILLIFFPSTCLPFCI